MNNYSQLQAYVKRSYGDEERNLLGFGVEVLIIGDDSH